MARGLRAARWSIRAVVVERGIWDVRFQVIRHAVPRTRQAERRLGLNVCPVL